MAFTPKRVLLWGAVDLGRTPLSLPAGRPSPTSLQCRPLIGHHEGYRRHHPTGLSLCTDLRRREAGCSKRDCQILKTHFDTKDGGKRNTDGPQQKEVKRSGTMFMAFMFVFLAAFSLYYVFDM
jgi:hypothetical protein